MSFRHAWMFLILLACTPDPESTTPTVPPVPEAPVESDRETTPTTERSAEPADDESEEAPAGPGEPETPLAVARAHCSDGWAAFVAGDHEAAGRALRAGEQDLRAMMLDGPGPRRALGACLYNLGRLAEEEGDAQRARRHYFDSLLYRDNPTVRARLATVSSDNSSPAPPATAPGSLFRHMRVVRERVCDGESPERFEWEPGVRDWHDTSCGVSILDLALEGTEHGAALLISHSGFDPEDPYDEDESFGEQRVLVTLRGGRWTEWSGSLLDGGPGAGTIDTVDVGLELRELVGGAPAELIVEVGYSYNYIPSASNGGGSYDGVLVCGDPDGPLGFRCASLWTGGHDSEEPDEPGEPSSRDVRFESEGRVVIITRMAPTYDEDGDEDEAREEREETTLQALWTSSDAE